MTFSIVARDGDALGVAVASRFLAVGSVVPAARVGVGAAATQSFAKVSYLADTLDALAAGASAEEAVARVTAADELREQRQLGLVSTTGAATWTGAECNPWAGGRSGGDAGSAYAVQGNILVGEEVVVAMETAWLASAGGPLPRRLLAALVAGDAAGGDRRGRQSAALLAVAPGAGYDDNDVLADLRVDDHAQPVGELARLLDLSELYFGHAEDVRPLEGALRDEVADRLRALGHGGDDVAAALADWAGVVNLETRLTPDGIDARVLDELRRAR